MSSTARTGRLIDWLSRRGVLPCRIGGRIRRPDRTRRPDWQTVVRVTDRVDGLPSRVEITLGEGLEAFVLRFPDLGRINRAFELDVHPSTGLGRRGINPQDKTTEVHGGLAGR